MSGQITYGPGHRFSLHFIHWQQLSHVLCVFCLGGVYRQCFGSELETVIVVNVGYKWALARLSCLHRHILEIWQDAWWGVKPGRRETPTSN